MIKIKSVESYQLPEKNLYEDFKTYRMAFTNGKYLVYHFLETSKKYLLVITSGYSDYWFHTDISKELSKKYSILILDTPGMGTATDKTKKDFYNIVSINSRVFYIDHVLDQFVNDSDDNNDNDNDSDDDSDNDSKFLKISFLAHSTSCLFITKYLEKGKRIKNIDKVIFNIPFFDINISGFKRFLGYLGDTSRKIVGYIWTQKHDFFLSISRLVFLRILGFESGWCLGLEKLSIWQGGYCKNQLLQKLDFS